jgi:DtxR family Mn-dependent transcriptional regulator
MVSHNIKMEYFMEHHNLEGSSESEQMYLITIARLVEDGSPVPVSLSEIAKEMSVLPVSVNQMVRKLEGEGLLHYFPYKGVELTDKGRSIATRTLRSRRLWEVFLVDQLNLSFEEADVIACTMEHITTDDIASRLSQLLGEPQFSPDGRPITQPQDEPVIQDWVPLTQLEVGMRGQIVNIESTTPASRFLDQEGIRPGLTITLKAIGSHGSRLVDPGNGFVELSEDLSQAIWVKGFPYENA